VPASKEQGRITSTHTTIYHHLSSSYTDNDSNTILLYYFISGLFAL